MVKLNLERLNTLSLYKVTYSEEYDDYRFVTDGGIVYSVGFEEDSILQSGESYQFIIINLTNKKSPRDTKLRETVMELIYAFFDSNNSALLYICETGDGKQGMRSRLFQYWYETASNKSHYIYITASLTDSDGIINHAALVLRTDNPDAEAITSEFTASIRLLSEKPQDV